MGCPRLPNLDPKQADLAHATRAPPPPLLGWFQVYGLMRSETIDYVQFLPLAIYHCEV
jgi:hypothetical protein